MPTPLIAKRPTAPSLTEQVIWLVFIGGPVFGFWFCWNRHQAIHLDNPWLNLAIHATLFVVPLIWAGLMYHKPVVYESQDGETILGTSTNFSRWRLNWWMMFLMWATPVFATAALGHAFFTRYLPHPESLTTSPGKASAILMVMTALAIFYGAILLGRSDPATWISSAGLRTGILRFHEWKDIHHMSQHGDIYAFYHRVNPALPASTFKVRDREAQALLERHLAEHQIPLLNDPHPALSRLKFAVVLGFLGNIAFSFWLRFNTSFSFVVVILISFGLGIMMTLVMEKYRGVSNYGKYKPIIEPPKDDEIGGTSKPIF